MPSLMFSTRLTFERERAYSAAAKAEKLSLSEWLKKLADEASGLTSGAGPLETQRPLDPNGPDPVAVPIKQRKKRGKVIVVEEPQGISGTRHGRVEKSPLPPEPTSPPSQLRQYTGETKVWNGTTMYEYGKGRWTKEPPPKK